MKKQHKILLAAVVVCILAAALWLYWEQEFSLAAQLPDEEWVKVQLHIGDPGVGQEQWQGTADLSRVLSLLEQTRVHRGPEFPGMSQPYFQLTLYKGESYPTHITVVANGQISVAAELDFDHYQYYEGGEELYRALLELTDGAA